MTKELIKEAEDFMLQLIAVNASKGPSYRMVEKLKEALKEQQQVMDDEELALQLTKELYPFPVSLVKIHKVRAAIKVMKEKL